MKFQITTLFLLLSLAFSCAQETKVDTQKVAEDLDEVINDIFKNYVYLEDKKVDLQCIKDYYAQQIPNIKTEEDTVLFFEYLLDEFYDSHVTLNTNRSSSYRLSAPFYVSIVEGKFIITEVWTSQIATDIENNIVGSELLKFNGMDIKTAIQKFPTHCNDKTDNTVREWIANKILAGRYNEPRMLSLKPVNGTVFTLNLDTIKLKPSSQMLQSRTVDNIGIIRINNSLGNNALIKEFDKTLDSLINTKGLIIDLRNTVDGGNSYVARGIMSRFINQPKPYQKHLYVEKYDGNTQVERSWVEYVSPRSQQYRKPVVVLVGRWTGSMGEGLAIGFEGMERATIIGTKMERLAGEMNGFSFKHQNFGYRLSTARLYHVNGTPREKYIPENYVEQSTLKKDETLEKAIELLKNSKF